MHLHRRAIPADRDQASTVATCGRCERPYLAASMIVVEGVSGVAIICGRCARRTSAVGAHLAVEAARDLRTATAAQQFRPGRRTRLVEIRPGSYVEEGSSAHQRYLSGA